MRSRNNSLPSIIELLTNQVKYICSIFWMHISYLDRDCPHLRTVALYNLILLNDNEMLTKSYNSETKKREGERVPEVSSSFSTEMSERIKSELNISGASSIMYIPTLSLFYADEYKDYQNTLQLVYFATHYLGFTVRNIEKKPQIPLTWASYLEHSAYDDATLRMTTNS